MDFVVAGFGLGAVLVLLGFAVRDVGPLLRRYRQPGALAAAWARCCREFGSTVVASGLVVCILTIVLLALGVADGASNLALTAAIALALIAIAIRAALLYRAFAYVRQFERPALPVEEPAAASPTTPAPARDVYDWPRRPHLPIPVDPRPAASEPADAASASVATTPAPAPAEPVEPTVAPSGHLPADAAPPIRDEEPANEEPASAAPETPPEIPAPPGAFASPVLADVGDDAGGESTGFRSALFADLTSTEGAEVSGGRFSSSLLADLTGGPSTTAPPAANLNGLSAKPNANGDDASPADPDLSRSAEGGGDTETARIAPAHGEPPRPKAVVPRADAGDN